jgi:hypothetical protein
MLSRILPFLQSDQSWMFQCTNKDRVRIGDAEGDLVVLGVLS